MLYLTVILAFLFLSYLYDYRGFEKGKLACWVSLAIVLICIAGFRYKLGSDTVRYEATYGDVPYLWNLKEKDFEDSRFGMLFYLSESLCRSISDDFMLFQFFEAALIVGVVFWVIWKQTAHKFFAGFLFAMLSYLMLTTETMREAFSVACFLLAFPYLVKRKWLQYYALSLIAFLFHVSAFLLFLVPLISVPGIRQLFVAGKRTVVIMLVLIGVSYTLQYFLYDFIKLISVSEGMTERADMYEHSNLGRSTLNVAGVLSILLQNAVYPAIAVFLLKIKNKKENSNDASAEWISMLTITGIYAVCLSSGVLILIRYVNYFGLFMILSMADVTFSSINIRGKRLRLNFLFWLCLYVPLIGWLCYNDYGQPWNKSGTIRRIDMYYPYTSRFNKELPPERLKAIEYNRRAMLKKRH